MSATGVSCIVFCLALCCQVLVTLAAPAVADREKRAVGNNHHKTRLSLILNSLEDDSAAPLEEIVAAEGSPAHHIQKRHAEAGNADDLDLDLVLPWETNVRPAVRRQRRSAAFMLHAAIQLCNRYPIYCHQVEVVEGDMDIKIRLREE